MTEQPFVDPGHVLPPEEWAKVVRRAKEVRDETLAAAAGGASSGIAPVLDMTAAGIRSGKYFPVSGIPTQLLVLHSAECPLAGGYAQSLTEWASSIYPADPIASWQRFVDPLVRLRFIPDELGAWHASEANVNSIGWEQAGYARYTREQWLTPDGLTQLESLAFDMAEVAVRDGIPPRWLSTAEVVAATQGGDRSIKGFCSHRQIDPETRTDPGDGYPYDLLMERIIFYMGGGSAINTQGSVIEAAPAIPEETDDMPIILAKAPNSPQIWRGNGLVRWPVWSMDTVNNLLFWHSKGAIEVYGGAVQEVPDLNSIGIDQMAVHGLTFEGKKL